jgi:hypothetical protein
MNELETEITDKIDRSTDHFNGSVTTTPVELTTSTNRPVALTCIYIPSKGPNANLTTAVLLVSWDNTNFVSYPTGTSEFYPGKGYGTNQNTIKIKANSGTVKYEIRMVS